MRQESNGQDDVQVYGDRRRGETRHRAVAVVAEGRRAQVGTPAPRDLLLLCEQSRRGASAPPITRKGQRRRRAFGDVVLGQAVVLNPSA